MLLKCLFTQKTHFWISIVKSFEALHSRFTKGRHWCGRMIKAFDWEFREQGFWSSIPRHSNYLHLNSGCKKSTDFSVSYNMAVTLIKLFITNKQCKNQYCQLNHIITAIKRFFWKKFKHLWQVNTMLIRLMTFCRMGISPVMVCLMSFCLLLCQIA